MRAPCPGARALRPADGDLGEPSRPWRAARAEAAGPKRERSAERAAGRQAGSVGREPDNRPAPSPGAGRRLEMEGRIALPFCVLIIAKNVDVVPDENLVASHHNQREDVEPHPRVRHVLH